MGRSRWEVCDFLMSPKCWTSNLGSLSSHSLYSLTFNSTETKEAVRKFSNNWPHFVETKRTKRMKSDLGIHCFVYMF
jgi:hypothetical protein